MANIRVFIADDHAVLRSGLRMLIQAEEGLEVVGEAGNLTQTVSRLATTPVDILTLDLSMPGSSGLSGITRIRQAFPDIRIVVLTMHDDPAYLRTALALGAGGYVVKSAADTELISAIRAVHRGRTFVDMQNATAATVSAANGASVAETSLAPIDLLSDREREVFLLVAQGHTNKYVAEQLDLSIKTIESYRARLMEKLGMSNRADLTRFAIEHGLLGGGPSDATR